MKRLFLLATILVVLVGCDSKSNADEVKSSNIKTSLYGHWVNEEEGKDYYISDGIIISTDSDGVLEKTYTVTDYDELKNMIVIKEVQEGGSHYIREITFNNDERKSLDAGIDTTTFEFVSDEYDEDMLKSINKRFQEANEGKILLEKWIYVDDNQ